MQIDRKSAAIFYLCWIQTSLGPILKPHPFKQLFSTSKVTTMLLNCFALEHSIFKTKQLSRLLVTLLLLNNSLNGRGLRLWCFKNLQVPSYRQGSVNGCNCRILLQIGFHPIVFATSRPATKIRSKSLRWSNEEKKNNTVVTQYPYMSMVNRGMAGCGVSTNRNTKIVYPKQNSIVP